jgi:hypothetical protein
LFVGAKRQLNARRVHFTIRTEYSSSAILQSGLSSRISKPPLEEEEEETGSKKHFEEFLHSKSPKFRKNGIKTLPRLQ